MMECLDKGEPLPFPIKGAVIYYVGPTPAPPGKPIGAPAHHQRQNGLVFPA